MAINKLLEFRNTDSTADINSRLAGLVPKGIVSGGIVQAEPNTLQVRVTGDGVNPWTFLVYSVEGMLVRGIGDVVLPVTAGTTNVIAVRARYVEGGEATGEVVSMLLGAFEVDPDPNSLIRLCSVTPDVGATAVQPTDIDFTFRDSIEGFRRNSLRGVVDTVADLPSSSGFPAVGEINFISNDFAANTTITIATPAVTATFPIVPPIEFNLAAPTSDPITAGLSRVNTSERTIVSAIEAALTGVVTVTTATPHSLSAGMQVRITGNAVSLNGVWTVATIVDATSFTYVKSGSLSPVMGTGGVVINTATTCTVTAHLAPGYLHNLLPAQSIVIEDAIDPSFNVASSVTSVIDAQTFTFIMSGYQTATSGGGRVVRIGVSIPPNGVQIGTTTTQTANAFEQVFRASTLASAIHSTAIGSSVNLQATLLGDVGNTYTLAKSEPGVLPGDEAIVLSGATFEGGADPVATNGVLELRPGDVYVVLYGESGSLEMWGFDGILFKNLTSAAFGTILDFHRRNLFDNEKHLTENQAAALEGSAGIPGPTNRFVTEQDASVLTVDLGNALQGADNVAPSNDNRFLTEARYRGERSDVEVPTGQNYVQLPATERWVVGNEAAFDEIAQYFNVVFTSTLLDPGGPTEYTQQDFTPVTAVGFYTNNALTTVLDPSDPVIGADGHGIYPRVEAASLSYPVDLYVKLSAIPDNGSCTVLYSRAVQEKFRSTTADMRAGPQRILPAEIATIDNKVAELRFNSGINPSGTTVVFPDNLFVAENLQQYTLRRRLGGRGVSLEDGFTINFEDGTGTAGIVEDFTPVALAVGEWTKYLVTLNVDGVVRVYPIANYLQYASDIASSMTLSSIGVPNNALPHGEWLFASVAVQGATGSDIEDILPSSIELYPYQDTRDPYTPITVGDSYSTYGHFSGPDALNRALKVVSKGDTIRLLPGNYLGQTLIQKEGVTLEWMEGASVSFKTLSVNTVPASWNTTTNEITSTSHGFVHNQPVRITTSGTLPTPIASGTTYYIQYVDQNKFKLSTTQNGPEVDITLGGSGTHKISTYVIDTPAASWNFTLYTIAYTAHGLYNNLAVKVETTSTLPTGILNTTTYYVQVVDANTIKLLDAPDGSVVTFSSQGVGVHTVTAERTGIIVDAADVSFRDAYFSDCDVGVRLTANATGFSPKGTAGFGSVTTNFDSSATVTKTSLLSNPYALTCTDGLSARYFGDYNSGDAIQDAIDAAEDGDTILIYPGTYNGFTVSKNRLYIIGQPGVYIDGSAIIVSGDENLLEGLTCTNTAVGIDCTGLKNVFDATVTFADTVKTHIKFPLTSGSKHGNFHPAVSGRGTHLTVGNDHGEKWVTVGDGISSWGDYNGQEALFDALDLEEPGTTIIVGKGTYSAVEGIAYNHMTVNGTGYECIIQAAQGSDAACLEVGGSYNSFSGFHLQASRTFPYDYSIIGIKATGDGNFFDRISFQETGTSLIAPNVRYVQASGSRNSIRSRTGAATDLVTYTVGDGVRSFGDFVGKTSGFSSAITALPQLPGGTAGAVLGTGSSVTFEDQASSFPVNFTNPASPYYVDALHRYITITSGTNQGTWKVTNIINATQVTITRTDGGSFAVDSSITWSIAVGTKIVVLPGTYDPLVIPQGKNDIVVEAWGDVVVTGSSPLITVSGNRCRVSGFRLEDTGTGIDVSGADNVFERNMFSSTLSGKYSVTGTGNRIYDAAENSDKVAYTISVYPSRGDFVGNSEVAIQAAIDAADADPHIKRVFIGAGTYTLTNTVTIPAGVSVFGSGYVTNLVGDGSFAAFTLTTGSQTISGIHFSNFSDSLYGPATNVFADGNWLTSAPINANVTGFTSDNL
jgi:hypothetical protein